MTTCELRMDAWQMPPIQRLLWHQPPAALSALGNAGIWVCTASRSLVRGPVVPNCCENQVAPRNTRLLRRRTGSLVKTISNGGCSRCGRAR